MDWLNKAVSCSFSLILFIFTCAYPSYARAQTISIELKGKASKYEKLLITSETLLPEPLRILYSECLPERIEKKLLSTSSIKRQGKILRDFLANCNTKISTPYLTNLMILLKKYLVDYPLWKNPLVNSIEITFNREDYSRTILGFVALKKVPRPLIILQCGLYCEGEESSAHRSSMMNFFDKAPFHVLSLGSQTGRDFQKTNKTVSIGGFDEGARLYELAKKIKNEGHLLGRPVSSIHIIGESIGGLSALYAGLYDSLNSRTNRRSISSIMALCPVVSLKSSIDHLFKHQLLAKYANYRTLSQLNSLIRHSPVLGKIFRSIDANRDDRVKEGVIYSALNEYKTISRQGWPYAPFSGLTISSRQQLMSVNEFPLFSQHMKIPTLVISSTDDFVVRNINNSDLLENSDYVQKINFQKGGHCAFQEGNHLKLINSMFHSFILSHQPNKDLFPTTRKQPIEAYSKNFLRLEKGEKIVNVHFKSLQKQDFVKVTLKVYDSKNAAPNDILTCSDYLPHLAPEECFFELESFLPLSLWNENAPFTSNQAKHLTRKLNYVTAVMGKDHQTVIGSSNTPNVLYIKSYR